MQQIKPWTWANRPTSIYTCAICEYKKGWRNYTNSRATDTLKYDRLKKLTDNTRQSLPISKRKLSQTSRLGSPEATNLKPLTHDDVPQYNFSVLPKVVKSSCESQIRQSLRNWSARNEEIKQETAPSDLPYEGRLIKIPNSLFLGTGHDVVEKEDLVDETIFDDQIDNQSLYRSGHMLRPGTLIHYASSVARRQDAVYLGEIGSQSLLLLANGRWVADQITQKRVAISRNRRYPIANFLTADEIEALRPHMPARDVARSIEEGATPQPISVAGTVPEAVVAPILAKFSKFSEAKQRFMKIHKTQLEQMYEKLAYEDEWRTLHIKAVTPIILGFDFDAMTDVAKKAFVDFASDCHPLFINLQTADTITYCIAPKSLNHALESVQEWSRLYQEAAAQAALGKNVSNLLRSNPLSGFIDKARRIIMRSRKTRSPTSVGIMGPAVKDDAFEPAQKLHSGESWTQDEKMIIDYMYDISMRRPESTVPRAHASLIARAIGAYPSMILDGKVFRLLLQEIGCIDPWTIVEDLNTPLSGRKTVRELDRLWREAQEAIAPMVNSKTASTEFTDSLAHIRSDWGGMEAFCVDSSQAQNREDAVSVEPANELEGGHWIHVHIAHASAHIDANHPVMHSARKRGTSHYDIDNRTPIQQLFPVEVLRQFSMGRSEATPVLTISTLLTSDGRVHDVKVSPRTISNIKKLDRDAVLKAAGASGQVEDAVLAVGKVSPSMLDPGMNRAKEQQQHMDYVSKFLPKLVLMQELLNARRRQRTREMKTPAHFKRTSLSSHTTVKLPENDIFDRTSYSYQWTEDPVIVVRGNRVLSESETFDEHRANDIIAQAMRLASESLGKWLSDRHMPAVYLGNDTPAFSIQELNEKTTSTEISTPLFTRTTFPRPLLAHNMKQYTGCTSPLRRFSDMLVHLQTDSYLKAEAQGLVQRGMPIEKDGVLAFTKSDLEKYLQGDVYASDAIDDFDRVQQGFWSTLALFRAFHFKEAALPEVFEVLVQRPARRNLRGEIDPPGASLIPWGFDVILDPTPEGYERAAGYHEFLPIKLLRVDPCAQQVTAIAVGPPTSTQQMVEPLRCLPSNLPQRSEPAVVQ